MKNYLKNAVNLYSNDDYILSTAIELYRNKIEMNQHYKERNLLLKIADFAFSMPNCHLRDQGLIYIDKLEYSRHLYAFRGDFSEVRYDAPALLGADIEYTESKKALFAIL